MTRSESLRAVAGWIDEHQVGGIYSGGLVTSADLRKIADDLEKEALLNDANGESED